MEIHPEHKKILAELISRSGKGTKHTFLENYLGTSHARYAISNPGMREIARNWSKANTALSANEFRDVVASLVKGKSYNEKLMAGFLLGYAKPHQRKFRVSTFNEWLDELEGWAEVDTLCTGKFAQIEIASNFDKWLPLLRKLARSKSIQKRRASLVLFCSPIAHSPDEAMADAALENIDKLKHEKDVLITKAISWLLRTMIRHHKNKVVGYLDTNGATLPSIAVRETTVKLKTGTKTKRP